MARNHGPISKPTTRIPGLLLLAALGACDGSSHSGHHECQYPLHKDSRDGAMVGEPVQLAVGPGQYDLQIPAVMKDWLDERNWASQHGNWHRVRRCGPVANETDLRLRGLSCAPLQEGQAGDGYGFLAMHRHMVQALKQSFPNSFPAIRGFSHVPLTTTDSENPLPWKTITWNDTQLQELALLEKIEDHVGAFKDDDDFGLWLQYNALITGMMGIPGVRPEGGAHIALHAQFAVPNSPYSLLDNRFNTYLVSFWRLHGWIDDVWTRFRAARGLGDDDPTLQQQMKEQCEGMHELNDSYLPEAPPPGAPETGEFATKVQPILLTYCRGCHSPGTRSASLVLAGVGLSAYAVRQGLVSQPSHEVGMRLVEPGSPEQSWLWRKLTGDFSGIDCVGCKNRMPQAGSAPNASELEVIRAWIAGGAP